jgi:hypothetical protein
VTWAWQVACIGESTNTYKDSVRKYTGKEYLKDRSKDVRITVKQILNK